MIKKARIANPKEMAIILLPFDRVFRQRRLSIFKSESILKNVDQCLFARCGMWDLISYFYDVYYWTGISGYLYTTLEFLHAIAHSDRPIRTV